uniref:Uncharacterized protein n=1 Tax=viral metagenome TaxID=1070528 RepID=A0A6C0CC73_9ZZZZ
MVLVFCINTIEYYCDDTKNNGISFLIYCLHNICFRIIILKRTLVFLISYVNIVILIAY